MRTVTGRVAILIVALLGSSYRLAGAADDLTASPGGDVQMPTAAECRRMGQAACENQRVRAQQNVQGRRTTNTGPIAAQPGSPNGGDAVSPAPDSATPLGNNPHLPTVRECRLMGQAACEALRVRAQQDAERRGMRTPAPAGSPSTALPPGGRPAGLQGLPGSVGAPPATSEPRNSGGQAAEAATPMLPGSNNGPVLSNGLPTPHLSARVPSSNSGPLEGRSSSEPAAAPSLAAGNGSAEPVRSPEPVNAAANAPSAVASATPQAELGNRSPRSSQPPAAGQPALATLANPQAGLPAQTAAVQPVPRANPVQQEFSLSSILVQARQLDLDAAVDQMAAIQAGQLTETDLSSERRANLAASRVALIQTLINRDRLQQQTDELERVLAATQTTREQILRSNDLDIANGTLAPEGLVVIDSLETAGRLGKLFDLPLRKEMATPFNLAEQSKSASEFVAKARDQADAMITEAESRATGQLGTSGSGADSVAGATGGDTNQTSNAIGRLRAGWANISMPTGPDQRTDHDTAVGAVNSTSQVKEIAARAQLDLDHRDPALSQILQLQTSILAARRLSLIARRAASLGLTEAVVDVRGPLP
jgi:hypothetical protein